MTEKISLMLDTHFNSFVARQVATGRYASEKDVILAGLKALEHAEAKANALRFMMNNGCENALIEYSFEQLIAEFDDFAA
ncbi:MULTISPECIES: type II toxin-antitoxin system ParD family antitoxin [unclassified Motilimonas]|uniref:type II toxin-antitoxin system ParD family antitoxin n=1 Tax=Motilimonas TaxID=1914248 RepID=UPI001E33C0A6|nr:MULTISPECIES: type II toxin-antitoxin system ParD family antitoxin [unclassified Motilimonas]MCE0556649.1 type II toxin-antitoxin system ParD family antitoxin [Motilimonas sp. E26]MDO6524784.1 type II toxin-antitoxin system ParD family antitoxin [Motilimonas sp. 1_MG-2023]